MGRREKGGGWKVQSSFFILFFSVLFHGVVFQCLHSSHLSSSWKLFQSLLDSALNDKVKKKLRKLQKIILKLFFRKITSHLSCCSSVVVATSISLPPSLHSHSSLPSHPHSHSVSFPHSDHVISSPYVS